MEEKRWEDMEADCLINIFQRVSMEDLTAAVPFVCSSWFRAAMDPLCWRILHFREIDLMPWSDFSKRFAANCPVRRLPFSGLLKLAVSRSEGAAVELQFPLVFGSSVQDLVYASDRCSKLKTVVLSNVLERDEPQLPEIVGKWRHLERLEMESKPSSFVEMVKQIGLNCRNFSGLKMVGSIKEEDVSAIVKELPRIKHLQLSESYLAKEQLLRILDGCRELESLIVRDCIGFEAHDEEILKKASGIKTFEHEGSKLFDDCGYETDECDPLYVHVAG